MSTKRFLPFRVLGERLTLTVDSPDAGLPRSPSGEVMANELDNDPLTLRFTLSDWERDIADVLPEPERVHPPVRVMLTFRSDQSRRRFARNWTTDEHLEVFDRSQWRGPLLVQAYVVRATNRPTLDDG